MEVGGDTIFFSSGGMGALTPLTKILRTFVFVDHWVRVGVVGYVLVWCVQASGVSTVVMGTSATLKVSRAGDDLASRAPAITTSTPMPSPTVIGISVSVYLYVSSLQCFDTVGWAAGRASGL